MEYEKQTEAQAHLYPTAPSGGQYPPPYASVQSPNPGGVAYPQHPAYPQPYHPANPNQQYGQSGYPTATQQPHGQAGYPSGQPGAPAYGYPAPGSVGYGQPQPIVVTTTAGYGPQAGVVAQQTTVSMIGAIVLSCFVLWCCGCLCGLIAFIVALVGQSKSSDGKAQIAIQLRNASYGISVAGIIIGIILTVLIVLYQNNHR